MKREECLLKYTQYEELGTHWAVDFITFIQSQIAPLAYYAKRIRPGAQPHLGRQLYTAPTTMDPPPPAGEFKATPQRHSRHGSSGRGQSPILKLYFLQPPLPRFTESFSLIICGDAADRPFMSWLFCVLYISKPTPAWIHLTDSSTSDREPREDQLSVFDPQGLWVFDLSLVLPWRASSSSQCIKWLSRWFSPRSAMYG